MELSLDNALQQAVSAHNKGKLQEAERLYRAILQAQPAHPDANHNLGLIAISVDQTSKALQLFKNALEANPKIEHFWLSYIEALIKNNQIKNAKKAIKKAQKNGFDLESFKTLSKRLLPAVNSRAPSQSLINNLVEQYRSKRYGDAEKLAMSIIQQYPNHQFTWKVLGGVLKQAGRFSEGLIANKKAVELDPEDAEAHYNLGNSLAALKKPTEAEGAFKQAIALKKNDAHAHNNLGVTLQALGRLEEAESSCRQAIAFNPDYAEAHNNLCNLLIAKGAFLSALDSARESVRLNPRLPSALLNMSALHCASGDITSAIETMLTATEIEPENQEFKSLLAVLEARKAKKNNGVGIDGWGSLDKEVGLISKPLISHLAVESTLITALYRTKSRELNETTTTDARFGNGRCSLDFSLFGDKRAIIQTVAKDLLYVMEKAVQSDVYIIDSFFNILGAGGGTTPHNHINSLDMLPGLNLGMQKYSLVYYLTTGDKHCSKPGVLRLYEPDEDILPTEGMIVIIPAGRQHSAIYNGSTDRVMIGINFYRL